MMKKGKMRDLYFVALVVAWVAFFAIGCSDGQTTKADNSRFSDSGAYIIEDYQTGCKYLKHDGGNDGGLTILLKEDGTPDCGRTKSFK